MRPPEKLWIWVRTAAVLFALSVHAQPAPEFECWTVLKNRLNPAGGYQVCTHVTYLGVVD